MFAKFSVKKPYTILVGVILVIVLGVVSFTRMTTDLLPDMSLPYVIVVTTDMGASPEEVEADVTAPIEAAMATTSNIKNVTSASYDNYSMVTMEYEQDTNMDSLIIEIQQKLDQLTGSFPDTAGTPMIMQIDPDMLPVMTVSADVEGLDQGELSTYITDELVPTLESLEGVASVSATGVLDEDIQVTMEQDKIDALNELILSKIDEQFVEAEEELNSAEDKINSGKSQLENGMDELSGSMSAANNEVNNQQLELYKGETQLETGLSTLEQTKGLLEKAIPVLKDVYNNYLESRVQLDSSIDEADRAREELLAQVQALIKASESIKLPDGIGGIVTGSTAAEGTNGIEAEGTESEGTTSTETGNPGTGSDGAGSDLLAQILALLQQSGIEDTTGIIAQIQGLIQQAQSGEISQEEAIAQIQALIQQAQTENGNSSEENSTESDSTESGSSTEAGDTGSNSTEGGSTGTTNDEGSTANPMTQILSALEEQLQTEISLQMLEQAGISVNSFDELPGLISTLSEKVVEMNTAIATMNTAKTQLSDGKTALSDAMLKIEETKISSVLQMSKGYADLVAAASQVELGKAQLEQAKESAEESADLTNILTADTLGNLLVAQNFSMPAGYVGEGKDQYLVRVGDKITSQKELENTILIDLGMDGIDPIRVSDVATVTMFDNSGESYSKVNGNPAIMFSIEKQTGYSTGDVTDRVLEKFEALEAENPNLRFVVMMDQGVYIDMIVKSVMDNMILGAILAIIVLILFLKDFRPTIVIACSIPLSVIFAIVLMYFSGISLNIISLSGLALGIGMLVDNSIVVIENIYRFRSEGYSVRKAAVEGASQVTGAIIGSTLTTVCVFAPIIFTEGITRQLFVDIALTIAFTLTASLVVAMTFVPMMAATTLKKTKETKQVFLDKVISGYEKLLRLALKWKPIVFLVTIALLVVSMAASFSRGMTFMDMNMESGQISVIVGPKEDETLEFEELTAMADEVVERVSTIEGIETIGAMMGGSSLSLMGGSGDSVSMYLLLEEGADITTAEIQKQIEELTSDLECAVTVDNSSSDMTALMGSGITVQIKGRDIEKLQELAGVVAKVVENTEGTIDVEDGLDNTTASFTISVDKEKAAEYGMTVAQVFQLVYAKMASETSATTISTDLNDYQVYVQGEEQEEVTLEDIKELTFTYTDKITGDEEEVTLTTIADFKEGLSMNSISRDAQTRYISVTAGIDEEHNVTLVSNEIQKELNKLDLPEGYSIKMTGEDEMINESMNQLYLMLLLAVIFIYLIMVAQFQSLLSPFIIMFTIPLAFTGGFFALYFSGFEIGVVAMIGFVMLAGIIVNNGIVLVDYMNQLRREGMDKKEAIVEAGKTRLRPVLMTALTTILAMSTMALGLGEGSEMMQPMAIVEVGGLVYGTLLTLFVVPCIYDAFNSNKSMVEEEL